MSDSSPSSAPRHPGQRIRDEVLVPKKLSVTAAAKLVGVGRPALSNFLNGHANTTPEMAARMERAFGIPAQELLDMQAAFDAAQTKGKHVAVGTKAYVPPFLSITANDVSDWSSQLSARARLAVLVRTLVNSTGIGLKKADFPGNDDSQRPGWDGYVECEQATQWIPQGLSGWEFGTNSDVKGKADGDFAKSVAATDKEERDHTTFVFLTPRRWAGKAQWISENKAQALWKDVRAYDASDIEQWIEQSIAAQAWFANETLRDSRGVRSLDKAWSDWADVVSPPLPGALFDSAINAAKQTMIKRLSGSPTEPTVVVADSTGEALAFLSQLFGPAGGEELSDYRENVLVFDEPGVLSKLAQGVKNFVAVVTTREVERELGPLARQLHSIVIYPRNATAADRHVTLEPLSYDAFRNSLEGAGYSRDHIARLDHESGRSLTVLRRRLATVPAIQTPEWAADHTVASSLVPFLFTGAWNSKNATDQTTLQLLANVETYETLERTCQRLVTLNDPPLWSVGTHRGVISKIDLLFAISTAITADDIRRFFEIARMVLGEDDPKLDLPEDQRWAASLHGKTREFSGVLRAGVSETLVLLALHGNHLFKVRLGVDCEVEVSRLIRELLTPLKARLLEANDRDLPLYAEAAPEQFLSVLEDDLRSDDPECYALMRPANSDPFKGGCSRTGILWALEGLAWNPKYLPRVCLVLAQLAEIEIEDNWINKPTNSLQSIFRVWMPQTAGSHEDRIAALRLIADKFPAVAWKICIEQLNTGHGTGHYSHKPTWRTDAYGFGEPFPTWSPILAFMRDVAEMVIAWKSFTPQMLCDLIERLPDLGDDDYREKVWGIVRSWADAGASDADKAIVREKIRVTVMSRRAARRSKKAELRKLADAAKAAYQTLEPNDIVSKHEWLFRDAWVDESADEQIDDDMNYRDRERRIAELRARALREVIAERGFAGVVELAEMGKAASQIGWSIASDVLEEADIPAFLLDALRPHENGESLARKNLIFGALRSIQDHDKRARVLEATSKGLAGDDLARLLLLAPFRRGTWKVVDTLETIHQEHYWSEVWPDWIHDSDEESNEGVERLLAAQRPRAAFASVSHGLEKVRPELLLRIMSEMLKAGNDKPGQYQLEQYYIEKAFSLLDANPTLTLEQKARLEFAYIDALAQPWREGGRGIPNLEKHVDAHPELFVQAIVWTYRRTDGGVDPDEWRVPPEEVSSFAERGHKLLDSLSRLPGRDHLGELQADLLSKWVQAVRDMCAELGRLKVADICLGKLLSEAPEGKDGIWPCEPVRQVMEEFHSKKMMSGAHTGRYNARGVTWRGEGGAQERALADKYRTWANGLQYTHPFVASELLMNLVKTYEYEAEQEDAEAGIRRRLR